MSHWPASGRRCRPTHRSGAVRGHEGWQLCAVMACGIGYGVGADEAITPVDGNIGLIAKHGIASSGTLRSTLRSFGQPIFTV